MTILSTDPRTDFVVTAGDVGGSTISYNFEIFASGDLQVTFQVGDAITGPLIASPT